MNLEKYLSVTPEIQAALAEGKPVVALESTILSHGMPLSLIHISSARRRFWSLPTLKRNST